MMEKEEQNPIIIREDHAEVLVSSPKYGDRAIFIDISDVEKIKSYRWYIGKNRSTYYAQTNVKQPNSVSRTLRMHNLLCETDGHLVDHIDRNGLNNRRANLRRSTNTQNQANRGTQSNNRSSGYKNVSYKKPRKPHHAPLKKPWRVEIRQHRKDHRFGYHETIEEAVAAANRGRKELFGEFAEIQRINNEK